MFYFFFFFFSSRRRHTRFDCDWSSDVCSSDLVHGPRRHLGPQADVKFKLALPGIFQRRVGALDHSWTRSEEHTSELQSQSNLVCRLLLEKKKKKKKKRKQKHKKKTQTHKITIQ